MVLTDGRASPGVILTSTKTFPTFSYPILSLLIGNFTQGPLESKIINTIEEFYYYYGTKNTVDSLSCLSYLQYAPNLLVKRVIGKNSYNASTEGHPEITVTSKDDFLYILDNEDFLHNKYIRMIAQNPGEYGNDLTVALFTYKEIQENVQINDNYKAKDIIFNLPQLHYCVAIFSKDILIESFTVQFNRIKDINDLSNYVYCNTQINTEIYGLYDGNLDMYDGNIDLYNGGSSLYDGNFGYHDGNICKIDGNERKPLFCIPIFIQDNILKLSGGITTQPTKTDFENTREEFENVEDYHIDFCIGNNCSLRRDDVLNFVSTPNTVLSAKDFVDTYDIKISTTEIESFSNIMFIYGMKKINKINIPLAADYCGQRAALIVADGLSVSNSSINNPMLVEDILHNPSFTEQEDLYSSQINTVVKEQGKVYCNGEIMYRKSAWL